MLLRAGSDSLRCASVAQDDKPFWVAQDDKPLWVARDDGEGGTHNGSWNPTLRREREGWGTQNFWSCWSPGALRME